MSSFCQSSKSLGMCFSYEFWSCWCNVISRSVLMGQFVHLGVVRNYFCAFLWKYFLKMSDMDMCIFVLFMCIVIVCSVLESYFVHPKVVRNCFCARLWVRYSVMSGVYLCWYWRFVICCLMCAASKDSDKGAWQPWPHLPMVKRLFAGFGEEDD